MLRKETIFQAQNDPKQFLTSIFVVSRPSASILLTKSELPPEERYTSLA